MPKLQLSKSTTECIEKQVTLIGIKPIMFDRYSGDNKTQLEPWQKLYFSKKDGKTLILPAINIKSFLAGENTTSAPKRLLSSKEYKKVANACLSFVSIEPDEIPFLRNGNPIEFHGLTGDSDPVSGVFIHRSVARLPKGIPNVQERPVLPLPWELKFKLILDANDEINEQQIANLFIRGGKALGLGTFRGVFGKFRLAEFN